MKATTQTGLSMWLSIHLYSRIWYLHKISSIFFYQKLNHKTDCTCGCATCFM